MHNVFQTAGEGNESMLVLGNWLKYAVDIDLPLLTLPGNEKNLIVDLNTQNAVNGNMFISLYKYKKYVQ